MGGRVREVAATYVVLGQAAAYFALYAIALDPATFHRLQLQLTTESDPHPPEQGQTACAPTAAETLAMRGDAMVLLLFAVAQAVTAMTAVAATSRLLTVCAQILSIPVALRLLDVLPGVVDLAIGRCHGWYHQALDTGCTVISVTFALLFFAGLAVTLCVCGENTGKSSSSPCDCGKAAVAIDIDSSREVKDTASAPRQGAVSKLQEGSGVRTVPNRTALTAVTPSKPAPAPSGGAATGSTESPSPKQRKINHGAASTSQATAAPPRPLGAPGMLASRPHGHTTCPPPLQYGLHPNPGSTQQQQHLPYQSLPQLQRPAYMFQPPALSPLPQPQPQQDIRCHGVHPAALMDALQDLSLSLQDSGAGAGWVAVSGATFHLTSGRSRIITQGGAATTMQQSLQLLQLPSPPPALDRLTDL